MRQVSPSIVCKAARVFRPVNVHHVPARVSHLLANQKRVLFEKKNPWKKLKMLVPKRRLLRCPFSTGFVTKIWQIRARFVPGCSLANFYPLSPFHPRRARPGSGPHTHPPLDRRTSRGAAQGRRPGLSGLLRTAENREIQFWDECPDTSDPHGGLSIRPVTKIEEESRLGVS